MADDLIDGAKAGGAGVAGGLLLGPVIGPPVAGFAADQFIGGSGIPWKSAGIAMGIGGLLLTGGASGASGTRTQRNSVSDRGWK